MSTSRIIQILSQTIWKHPQPNSREKLKTGTNYSFLTLDLAHQLWFLNMGISPNEEDAHLLECASTQPLKNALPCGLSDPSACLAHGKVSSILYTIFTYPISTHAHMCAYSSKHSKYSLIEKLNCILILKTWSIYYMCLVAATLANLDRKVLKVEQATKSQLSHLSPNNQVTFS